ncbi:peptidoglycan editing factor PgeF [Diaphorobacter caeni]|uniref:peptidoglycan editing factor PgeF n=1 Tax=Diaphorobacter caeni TaxID=2784387 RepID=UPI00188F8FEF|nr:peptidoglycan editing factor PgeF [Diaphorobacter caeni]MBF5007425.1 peptidoglycan editing factor PgeF [Diaphorobacter caeni]
MKDESALAVDWLIPDWPVREHVRALCSTRAGGVSEGPFGSLNLGDHVQDDALAVQRNREIFGAALTTAAGVAHPVFLNQVHGTHVEWLRRGTADGTQADACATLEEGVACVIMVADCLPVLFTNRQGDQVAAAHAGWRGLAGPTGGTGILEEVVAEFARTDEVIAWLGPCIGPTAFEVGAEVRAAFCEAGASAERFFKPLGEHKFLADLAGLARHRLQRAGVASIHGNDSSLPWCTFSNPERFFSYRRDQRALGGSGRLAAAVWLDRRV